MVTRCHRYLVMSTQRCEMSLFEMHDSSTDEDTEGNLSDGDDGGAADNTDGLSECRDNYICDDERNSVDEDDLNCNEGSDEGEGTEGCNEEEGTYCQDFETNFEDTRCVDDDASDDLQEESGAMNEGACSDVYFVGVEGECSFKAQNVELNADQAENSTHKNIPHTNKSRRGGFGKRGRGNWNRGKYGGNNNNNSVNNNKNRKNNRGNKGNQNENSTIGEGEKRQDESTKPQGRCADSQNPDPVDTGNSSQRQQKGGAKNNQKSNQNWGNGKNNHQNGNNNNNNSNNNNWNNNKGNNANKNNNSNWNNNNSNWNNNNNNNNNKGNNNNNNNNNNKGNNNNNNNNNKGNNNNNQNKKNDGENNKPQIFRSAKEVLQQYWNKKKQVDPVDSFILKLHYRTSVFVFHLLFVIVQSNWYFRDPIKCINPHYSERENMPFHLINFCLSYPYVCDSTTSPQDGCSRRYLLFYRWIYTSFLTISLIYYLPRFVAKKLMNPRLKEILADLLRNEGRYDNLSSEAMTDKMHAFFTAERGTSLQYTCLVLCHVIALSIDISVVYFFNFMLHNRFTGLLYEAYPYQRNPVLLNDYISETFPPFANCTVMRIHLINNAREDTFGCYLYLMELYDKVFIFLWVWLMFLTVVTTLSLSIHLLFAFPPLDWSFLFLFSSSHGIRQLKRKVYAMSNLNDLYILYLFKQRISENQFIKFMSKVVHNSEETLEEVVTDGIEIMESSGEPLSVKWKSNEDKLAPTSQILSLIPPSDDNSAFTKQRWLASSVQA